MDACTVDECKTHQDREISNNTPIMMHVKPSIDMAALVSELYLDLANEKKTTAHFFDQMCKLYAEKKAAEMSTKADMLEMGAQIENLKIAKANLEAKAEELEAEKKTATADLVDQLFDLDDDDEKGVEEMLTKADMLHMETKKDHLKLLISNIRDDTKELVVKLKAEICELKYKLQESEATMKKVENAFISERGLWNAKVDNLKAENMKLKRRT